MPHANRIASLATVALIIAMLAILAAISGSADAQLAPTGQQGEVSDITRQTNTELIDAVHREYLGRDARKAENNRWLDRLGVTINEAQLRAGVLGTKSFYAASGTTHREWIEAMVDAVHDRPATTDEIRSMRRTIKSHPESGPTARRELAFAQLELADRDTDAFAATDIRAVREDDGRVQRIVVDLDRTVSSNTSAIEVHGHNTTLTGSTRIRANGERIVLVLDQPTDVNVPLVVTVFDWSDGIVRRADGTLDLSARWETERMFPDRRIVAYYGNHITPLLGVLGETGPERAAERVKAAAARFDEPGRPGIGAFEMIVTVAQGSAGADGNYSHPSNIDDLRPWIEVARREGLYVILDIQPGRSDFYTESIRYEELLKEPHVGLALDPEWRMGPGQRPNQVVGSVTAAEVNRVSEWLSDLVIENDLPEKMFIVHQFQTRMIKNREDLVDRPGLATIIHADGFGGRAIKLQTYSLLQVDAPLWNGFKLFIDEDTNIFQPADVLAFDTVPVPDLITYQ